ncbi:MAG TPA: hypothetical protein VFX70_11315, partial [Mycobacteriales bacterium]|nr:hypothetical protein [Mycobacteriales bacterium]
MDSESTGARYTAPYVVSAVCAGAGVVLRLVSGPGAVAVAVVVPLIVAAAVAVAHRVGRPIIGVDRRVEVGYVTAVLAALSGWTS